MNDTNNFNDELMKMLQESYDKNNETIETCLISNEPLEENFVMLECSHKFNYKDIYNEVYKQKTQPWHSEINKVKNTQLKCPYCRNIQTGLLPYREGYSKVKYVNWPPFLMMLPDTCNYIFASGKRKGQTCSKKCNGKYCISHEKIMLKRQKKKLEKEKLKLEKHNEKNKIKLDKIKAEMQQKLNELSPAMVNLVLSTPNIGVTPHAANADALANVQIEQIMSITTPASTPIVVTCAYKFKKGKNKGNNCQCRKIHKDGLCKFHYRKYKQAIDKKKSQLEKINQNIKIKKVGFNQNQNLIITI